MIDNLGNMLKVKLLEDGREPDGLLHCSGLAHCEYSQIQQAVGEVKPGEPEFIDLVVMMTGTLWHKYIQESFPGHILLPEFDLTPWLPQGWAGSMDGLWLDKRTNAVEIIDIKTMAGEGMRFIKGVKPEHKWQVSAYYYGVQRWWEETKPKFGLSNQCNVFYMPVSRAKEYYAKPVLVSFTPHNREKVIKEMNLRANNVEYYKGNNHSNLGKLMPLTITAGRAAGGWKAINERPNWWVPYCPAMDCPCSTIKGKGRIGTISPGGELTINDFSRYTVEELDEILKEQNER